ncbi:hypothetical protein SNOG_01462 [Parastagonospora nodorum SN15]|uniref:Uncharacterized protein n=1 Tax=Phaeosphaeria nodorum (strain SN15 / ATCC MYA-4574 / FGSC 10173) TaxID=321614 RepID=Q0V3F2_PHANO|nr:hypothetical protein SNOG_01462 [Parastagonospora nodorum SN15]EAT91111.1 hypothetical protein SNOG_01462 [Parastagonospora nodorum SN15]
MTAWSRCSNPAGRHFSEMFAAKIALQALALRKDGEYFAPPSSSQIYSCYVRTLLLIDLSLHLRLQPQRISISTVAYVQGAAKSTIKVTDESQ